MSISHNNIHCIIIFVPAIIIISDLKNDADLRENLRPFQSEAGNADFGLQHFTYDNNVLLNNIFGHLSTTDFFGIVVCNSYGIYVDTMFLLCSC